MKKRLLVTGLGGFVAGSVIEQGRAQWDIAALSSPRQRIDLPGIACHSIDLCDSAALAAYFQAHTPDAVIHTAARADIDYCQKNPEEAEAINVGVTRTLAQLCEKAGARLVHCSTDTVFDGKRGNYTEEDTPRPVNWYGETKVRSEEAVLETLPDSVVARVCLVMGLPLHGTGNTFLPKVIASLEKGHPVAFPANEIRTPIDVLTLGEALLELAGNTVTGILHLAGNTRLNRYEMGKAIAGRLGFPTGLVEATDSNSMPDRAPRPNDASLDNSKARSLLRTSMKSLMEGLDHVMHYKEKHHG
jgi:dTDP-4-dehydrorhamnose reductase